MDRLSGDFIRGYTRAIQDIISQFRTSNADLRGHHKRMNEKLAISLLEFYLKNREILREGYTNGYFIRWNNRLDDWELIQDIRYKKGQSF